MSMMDEIEKLMNGVDTSLNFRIVNLGGNFLYIEGIKNVLNFGLNEMSFQLKNKILTVSGKALKINYLDKTTCVIQGEIESVVTK